MSPTPFAALGGGVFHFSVTHIISFRNDPLYVVSQLESRRQRRTSRHDANIHVHMRVGSQSRKLRRSQRQSRPHLVWK